MGDDFKDLAADIEDLMCPWYLVLALGILYLPFMLLESFSRKALKFLGDEPI